MSNGTRTSRSKPVEAEPKQEKSGPVFNRRCWTGSGSIECAVFIKEIDTDNGTFPTYNTTIKRSWKTDQGYESSSSLRQEDLLIAALFLQECASWIATEQSRR